ncbi:methylenetetrahydrofolate reductase [Gordonia araii]|uniref:methylenetetrahydrofolate reductase n=1 Tax=Gordonia araii TaxID=263909 RepID=UPI00031781D1|nr:methylenetetrahydrofolate reductase [Gordonia araii]NNG99220.1 5,10-methylenetetrahydrofolate reductase [Gordonia araii NBRC 100433]
MGLAERIAQRDDGVLLFSLTPPRSATSPDDAQRIADVTLARLESLDLDGLVLYDIDDESDRNPAERPFPYLPTMDPAAFLADHLSRWRRPVVVYRCVGKYDESSMEEWLARQDPASVLTVFVGASSDDKPRALELPAAQKLRAEVNPKLQLGGVAIPERHSRTGAEHLRMVAKQQSGVSFFVTQVVYDVSAAKSMLSDYFYACAEAGLAPVPVIFTLSVCGSMKTVEFLEWLGVDVPRWLRNDLAHSDDPLAASFRQCMAAADELADFARRLGTPHGFNVESVSNRRREIEASVELAARLRP